VNSLNETYYPGPWNDWVQKKPDDVGLDPIKVKEAIKFSNDHENPVPIDLGRYQADVMGAKKYDDGKILGPTRARGGVNGIILRHGYIVAEWGDTLRTDMTFSYSAGNPDDVYRELEEPGTYYEYNDVRVNLTALSLLHVWRKPLPQVLKEEIMDPIQASNTWRWYGYENSWVNIDGMQIQSVSGGGHWGGGFQISSRDHARFGYLFLRQGLWKSQQLLTKNWIQMITKPGDVNPVYGYMWWLNPGKQKWPSAPETSFSAIGFGGNFIWVDPEHDLVVVTRWVDSEQFDGILKRVLASIN